MKLLKNELNGTFLIKNLLLFMRIKEGFATKKLTSVYGWKISKLFSEESNIVLAAQSYDKFWFDFYIY